MSRIILHNGNRFTVVAGIDHVLKSFVQVYDKTKENKTPEGEGLIFDWSVALGLEINKTNIDINNYKGTVFDLIKKYIQSQSPREGKNLDLVL
jgi:hypothetical protein